MCSRTLIDAVAFVVIVSTGLVTCNLPSIDKTIEKETKPAGQEGMLNCTVSDKSTNKVLWQRVIPGGRNEAMSSDSQILTNNPRESSGLEKYRVIVTRLSPTKEVYTLAVRSLQDFDSGTYECVMMITGMDPSTYPRARGDLVVQLPPSLKDSAITTKVQIATGGTAVLFCDADGVPTPRISWSRANGKALSNGQSTTYGKELVIANASAADRGAYRCKAENDVKPPAVIDVTLDVFYRPVLYPFRQYVGQAPGRNYEVRLSCRVSGNPEPVARWVRVEGLKRTGLADSEKYRIDKLKWLPGTDMKVGDYWYDLVIKNVGDGDRGTFQCEAANLYGTSITNFTVFMTTTCQTWKCWSLTDIGGAQTNVISMVTLLLTLTFAIISTR